MQTRIYVFTQVYMYLYLFLLLLQIWKCTRVGQTGNWQLIWPIYMPKVGDDTEYLSSPHHPSAILHRPSGSQVREQRVNHFIPQ